MPMIDVYAAAGTFADKHTPRPRPGRPRSCRSSRCRTSRCSARTPRPSSTTCPPIALSNVDGESTYVRVQVLTNAGALDRAKQLAVDGSALTNIVADAAGTRR